MFFRAHQATMHARLPLTVNVLFIFGIALLLRVSVSYYNIVTASESLLFPDSRGYYRTAVNLANGNGYVEKRGQEPYFFREPGTIYFYAASVAMYKAVTGRSVSEPSYENGTSPQDHDNRNAIRLIRLSQAIWQALALALFYLLLRHHFKDVFSFIVASLVSLYPPLAAFSEHLLRENILLGILMGVAYLLSSQIQRPAHWKLAALGILWGLSALTLQVYMVLGAFLFAFVALHARTVVPAAKRCAVIGALFLLTVCPWLYRVYTFYPDVRIAGSMGCALTSDWSRFKTSFLFARSHPQGLSGTGRIPPDEVLATDVYAFTARECFDKAFSGYFKQTARRLDAEYGVPSARERAAEAIGMLAWFLVLPGYHYGDWSATRGVVAHDHGNMVVTMFISFVLSSFSLIGIWICFRKASSILPIYLFHLAFFWLLMNESRRAMPIVPFFVLFGVIGLVKVIQWGFPPSRFSILRES